MNEMSVIEQKPLARVESSDIDIGAVIQSALASGRPMSDIKEAMDLYERMQAMRREQLFNAAFAKFKAACPPVVRRTEDAYNKVIRDGVQRSRKYASLDDILITVDPPLHANGLTYHWSDPNAEPLKSGFIIRHFVLTHESGHSRSTASPPIPIEGTDAFKALSKKADGSDRKDTSASPQQRMGVADTYAKRYSMTSGLGIPTCDEDDDCAPRKDVEYITDEQCATINDLLIQTNSNKPAFLKWMKVEKLSEIPVSQFDLAVKEVQKKIKPKGVA